jgi:hypothetical protein
LRADDVDVAWARASVILPHTINVKREMFVEGMADACSKSIPRPNVQTPFIKHLVTNRERKVCLSNPKRMLDQNGVAISPGIHLRLAPAAFEPVAVGERELSQGEAHGRTQRQTVLTLRAAVGWFRFAVQIEFINGDILSGFVIEAKTPPLIHGRGQVAAYSQRPLNKKIDALVKWNHELNIVPTLGIGFRDEGLRPRGTLTGCESKYGDKRQKERPEKLHPGLASV